MTEKNRRIAYRWQLKLPSRIKINQTHEFIDCVVEDVNYKGLQLACSKTLAKDRVYNLSIKFSEELIISNFDAWLVWQKPGKDTNIYGFYFVRIKDTDKEKIYEFVRQNAPEQINKQCWYDERSPRGGDIMQNMDAEDKRVFARFPVKLTLRFLDLMANQEGQAQAQDISAKGIGIKTNQMLRPNTPLEMWLQVPDKGEPLYTRGEVVWSEVDMSEPHRFRAGVNLDRADLMGVSRVMRVMKQHI